MKRIEHGLELFIFNSRWLLLPFYLGLVAAIGLLLVKFVAIALGILCWRLGRGRLLFRMNLFFALLVTWNIVAIIVRPLA